MSLVVGEIEIYRFECCGSVALQSRRMSSIEDFTYSVGAYQKS